MTGRELLPCGTPAAYQRHRYRGETPCRPCLDANNQKRLERLAKIAGQAEKDAAYAAAYRRALARLRTIHRAEFRELLTSELDET